MKIEEFTKPLEDKIDTLIKENEQLRNAYEPGCNNTI